MTVILNKRNFPSMSRVIYDFRQVFGEVEYTYAKEGANEYGERWQGHGVQPVLELEAKKKK